MKQGRFFFLLTGLLCHTALAGTPWRSSVYPDNWSPERIANKSFENDAFIQDFSVAGYRYGAEPPTRPAAQIFDVTQAPFNADNSGTTDSTAAIQAAINAAQAVTDENNPGGIVYLPAGTYRIAPPDGRKEALRISKSHITLRGAGVGKTFLLNTRLDMREKRVIRVRPYGFQSPYADRPPKILLAKDVLTPTKHIPLQSVDGLRIGQWIVLRNEVTDGWADEHRAPQWKTADAKKTLRGQFYIRKIEQIDTQNNTIVVDIPIRYYLKKRDKARLHGLAEGFLTEVGIESLSIGMLEQPGAGFEESDWKNSGKAAYKNHDAEMLDIERTYNGWIKNVSTFQPTANRRDVHILSNGVLLRETARISVIDTTVKNVQYGGGGGNGYGFTLSDAQDSLLLRTEAHYTRHGYTLSKLGTSGNVMHRCVEVDTGHAKGDGNGYLTHGRASDTHAHLTQSNLFDQCRSIRSGFESRYRPYTRIVHGQTSAHTVFWNTQGQGKGKYIPALVWSQQSRYGYAIGTHGDFNAIKVTNGTDDAKTAPKDIAEGEGKGQDLQPQSLWLDQRERRFERGNFSDGFEQP